MISKASAGGEDGDAAAHGVVERAGERLGAAIDVDDDRLRPSADLGEAVGGGERHHLVGTGDDGRDDPPGRPCLGDRLDQRRMVAAEIGEDMRHARFRQRVEQRHGGCMH